jgi:hypothetical protein
LKWGLDDGYALIRAEFKKFVPGFVLPIVRRAQTKNRERWWKDLPVLGG